MPTDSHFSSLTAPVRKRVADRAPAARSLRVLEGHTDGDGVVERGLGFPQRLPEFPQALQSAWVQYARRQRRFLPG